MTPKKEVTTGEREAIRDEIVEELSSEIVTPTPEGGVSAATARRLARTEARPLIQTAVSEHKDECLAPGGGLCTVRQKVEDVEKKVDQILLTLAGHQGAARVWGLLRAAAGAVALAVLGFTLNHFAARRSEDTLRRQIESAATVAQALKAVQDAANKK